jgi:Ser/Thr protein kinase RdoA (MazF antagonist)
MPAAPDVFPVTHAVFAPARLGVELAALYGLTGAIGCVLLRRGFHDTYILTAGGTRYVIRVYRASKKDSEIAYELQLLVHLARRGAMVSAPIADRGGRLAVPLDAPEGERYAAVFTFAEGRSLSWNPEVGARAGALLGSIHSGADDFVTKDERAPLSLERLLDCSLAALRPYCERRSHDWSFLNHVADRIRTATAAVEDQLDWGVCHGDFNNGNIHVGPDQTLTVFDFDFCGPGWRSYDLVGAWRSAEALDPQIWTAFLCGYRSVRRLSDVDVGVAALFDGISRFRSLGLRAANAPYRGTQPVAGCKLGRHLKYLTTWASTHLGDDAQMRGAL